MKYLIALFIFQLYSLPSFAQRLNTQNTYTPLYQTFQNSYFDFNNNYSSYNPYLPQSTLPATQEDYYKLLNQKIQKRDQSGKAKKIISYNPKFVDPTQDIEQIIDPIADILYKVPHIGQPPAVVCEEAEKKREVVHMTRMEPILITTIPLPKEFNKRCENFIKPDGKIGPWGTYIKDYIEKDNELFFSPALPGMQSIPKTCPMWGILDDETKTEFWIWMFASIAQVESSCNNKAVNTGKVPNPADRPRGLLQLNTLKKSRSWRGENCKFPSDHDSVYDPKNNITCGLDIMKEILKGKDGVYKTSGKIFPTNSYWEKLRNNHSSSGGPIGKLSRSFKPCGATP